MIGPFPRWSCSIWQGPPSTDDGAVDEAFATALSSVGVRPDSPQLRLGPDLRARHDGPIQGRCVRSAAGAASGRPGHGRIRRGLRAHRRRAGACSRWKARSRPLRRCGRTTSRSASRRDSRPAPAMRSIASLGWQSLIDLALSPVDCGRGRPAPDMIFGAMQRLARRRRRSGGGRRGHREPISRPAQTHGAGAVIGVLTGAHDRATLSSAPHTDLIEDLSGLIGVLTRR